MELIREIVLDDKELKSACLQNSRAQSQPTCCCRKNLMAAKPILMAGALSVFVSLCLLDTAFGQGERNCGQYVFALRGDTCVELRSAFHMSSADFDSLNANVDCDRLRPRQTKICVASRQQMQQWRADTNRRCPGPRVKVIRGDTCSKIGARLDVDQDHFTSHNRRVDCDNLSTGDTVCGAPQTGYGLVEDGKY